MTGASLSTDEIYQRLRAAILEGEFEAGSVMSQVALSESIGVSRTPLREALRMLQGERLILAERGRRVRVAPMSASDLEELYIARVTLEAQAMRISTPLLQSEAIAELEGYMAAMAHYARETDYRRWLEPHQKFHRALTRPAGTRINELLDQLFDHSERYRRLHIGYGPSAWATAGHREILNACIRGERDRSAALLAEHLTRTGLEVAQILDPDYAADRLRAVAADAMRLMDQDGLAGRRI